MTSEASFYSERLAHKEHELDVGPPTYQYRLSLYQNQTLKFLGNHAHAQGQFLGASSCL